MTNTDKNIAVRIEGVYKDFVLPHEKKATVKSAFTNIFNRSKGVEVQHALNDISLEIEEGEFFGIVGRNGSGKSTLLKILAGIYQPTKGEVHTKGLIAPFIELGVGFNPELTGRENVYLNGAMMGFSTREVDARYEDIVSFAELSRFMDQKLKNYSSGMQVRLAFSVATRARADILLVDEVLAVGDAEFQAKCFNYFKKLKRDKKTVIFVTHNMDAIREYCDRAILIDNSRIKLNAIADKVATAYSHLFFEEERTQKTTQMRWGNEKVKIDKIKITPVSLVDKDKQINIEVLITAKENIENPICGFLIKNQAGQPILGSNNDIEKHKMESLKKGESTKISWTVPHIFGRGVYYVDPSIIEHGTNDVYDWWQEAAAFVVHKERVTPYMVNPNIGLEISTVQKKS
jgi:ABC-2 type transport system ATP-binding protein